VDATAGGTIRLRAAGTDLTGEWISAKGDKTFPVRLTPGPRWTASWLDAGASLLVQAEACLEDPACPAAEADRLFVVADDGHATSWLDCPRFLGGVGTRRDLTRARACFERSIGKATCEEGNSAGLPQAQLAVMLIDGAGGPVDIPRARALFAGCFDDSTAKDVLAHADAKEVDPGTEPEDFCGPDHRGTTLTSNDCFAQQVTEEETRGELLAKRVVAGFDDTGRRLFLDAGKAYAGYARARGAYGYEGSIQGSIRNMVALTTERALYRRRTREIAGLSRFVAPTTSTKQVSDAEKGAAAAFKAVVVDTPGEKAALEETQLTWSAYREAEVRFYVQAFGPKQGAERVERAVRARLEAIRATECDAPGPSE
jgi:hypothetical protein